MAKDVLSKCSVILALEDRLSTTWVRWFYTTILCEYGYPWFIHTDRGKKLTKYFGELVQEFYFAHHMDSNVYPPANGQMQIFKKTIECSLCKVLYLYPIALRDNLKHNIKLGLRIVVSGVHSYIPFEVIYKQPRLI